MFVLAKIDEILAWEENTEHERDTRFVELGRYLCEVRAGQYWRVDNLKSFDEFLEKKFPESRRKAYYLMAIHEQLPQQGRPSLKLMGWTKARELAKVARMDGQKFDCAPWVHKARTMPRDEFKREVERHLTGKETEPWEMLYFEDPCPNTLADEVCSRQKIAQIISRQWPRAFCPPSINEAVSIACSMTDSSVCCGFR